MAGDATDPSQPPRAGAPTALAGPIEHVCEIICAVALVAMMVLIGAEVLVRSVLGFSLQITDEIGGYLLVAISFLSLPVAEAHGAFHHVEFVQSRLGERGRLVSRLVFDLLSLAFCVLLDWQLIRVEIATWRSGDVAPTILATPLWIPEMAMAIGTTVLCFTLVKTILARARRLMAVTTPHAP
jgi:TRAP-type C4-dicarboxylate transport system permease small subunit